MHGQRSLDRALLRCVAAILVPDRVADGLQQQLIAGATAQQFAQWFPGGGKQAGVKLAGCSDAQAVAACTEWIADGRDHRSEEHTSELQSLMRISYAVFCLKKQK